MIGRTGGSQPISLGKGCLIKGVIVHELMHAIGFYHMHSRSDRDQYLRILWPNIHEEMQSQFRRNQRSQDILFRPFDFDSIMLYGPKLFSKNGQDTMIPLERHARLLDTGHKAGLSDEDARSINMLYNCFPSSDHLPPVRTTTTTTTTTTSTTTTEVPVTDPPTRRRNRRRYGHPVMTSTSLRPTRRWNKYWDKQSDARSLIDSRRM